MSSHFGTYVFVTITPTSKDPNKGLVNIITIALVLQYIIGTCDCLNVTDLDTVTLCFECLLQKTSAR